MDLKAFKGLPHEFGGIDYTEGSEVEGGEFAVKIGKSGNEYIFDKNSSEGEKLSKEYKRLDTNGRLSEDDPLSLETFDQIAREEALKHAQRSVNEKGIDPFRNMYDQGGQAANGGVKYATGGPKQMGAPESRMRTTSFGDQEQRIESEQVGRKDIPAWKEAGLLMGDIFLTPVTSAFTGKSFSEMAMADSPYRSSEATRRAVGDDTMTGTAFGYGFAESEGVISNMGTQFFSKQGGALPKDKYAQGGASGQKDMYMGGGGWMQLFEGIHNVRQGSKQMAGPYIDNMYEDQRYVRQPIAGPPTTTGGGGFVIPKKQQEPEAEENPWAMPESGLDQEWMMDDSQLKDRPIVSDIPITEDVPIDLGIDSTGGSFGSFGGFKNGGAKKGVYGYYANGGGKKNIYGPGGVTDPTDPKKKELAGSKKTSNSLHPSFTDFFTNEEQLGMLNKSFDQNTFGSEVAVKDNTSAPITPLWDIAQQVEEIDKRKTDIETPEGALEWTRNWINSPMHKEMLTAELQVPTGNYKDRLSVEDYTRKRLENLNDLNINIEDLSHDPVATRGKSDGSFSKGYALDSGDIMVHDESDDANVLIHEVSHGTDAPSWLDKLFNNRLIPYSSKKKISDYRWNQELQGNILDKPVKGSLMYDPFNSLNEKEISEKEASNKKWANYIGRDTETRARLNSIRAVAQKLGIYDPFTEKLNEGSMHYIKELSNYLTTKDQNLNPYNQLKDLFTDEEIMDMLNTISYEESSDNENSFDNEIFQAKHGGVHKDKDGTVLAKQDNTNVSINPLLEIAQQEALRSGIPLGHTGKSGVVGVDSSNVTEDGSQIFEYVLPEAVAEATKDPIYYDKSDSALLGLNENQVVDNANNRAISNSSSEEGFLSSLVPEIPNFMPSNAKAYAQGILGRKKDFTEADLTSSEMEMLLKILKNREIEDQYLADQYNNGQDIYDQKKYLGYDDYNRFGASSLHDKTTRHLTDPASRLKTLLGRAEIIEHDDYYEIVSNPYDFDDYTDTPLSEMSLLNKAEHFYNESPFIQNQKKKGEAPMNMRFRIPKNLT